MGRSSGLTAEKWVEIGLKALSSQGHEALKADLLSKAQGVTRGSFYHHFSNVTDFHAAVIDRWKEQATDRVILAVEMPGNPRTALEKLLYLSFGRVERIERRMRIWAENDPLPRAAVEGIDRRRVAYVTALLGDMGYSPVVAATRANIIYDCYVGCALRRAPEPKELDDLVSEIINWCALPQ